MRFYPLSIIIVCGILDPARTLQIFNGTLTEITCSAAIPAYCLVHQEIVYDSYTELPDLFDIEARPSPTGINVTLYINGTNRSNNVTVICGYVDVSAGISFNSLFTLILEFVGILPAPNDVHYIIIEDSTGCLQILWEPPTLVSDEPGSQNINIDSRITHFIIYITNESTITVYNTSGTFFAIEIDEISCTFWFQVAAVNPAGVGERSPPQTFNWCMGSTSSTTHMIMDPIPASSGLSAGEITAIIVGVVLIITGLLVILAIAFANLKNDRHRHVIQNLKSEIRSDQLSNPTENSVTEIEKCVESEHCSSGNDPSIADKKQQSDSTPTRSYSQDGPPVLYFTEINVLTKKQNKVPEPSSTEETSLHVYAILEQPPPQITDTDQDNNDDDNPDSQD